MASWRSTAARISTLVAGSGRAVRMRSSATRGASSAAVTGAGPVGQSVDGNVDVLGRGRRLAFDQGGDRLGDRGEVLEGQRRRSPADLGPQAGESGGDLSEDVAETVDTRGDPTLRREPRQSIAARRLAGAGEVAPHATQAERKRLEVAVQRGDCIGPAPRSDRGWEP